MVADNKVAAVIVAVYPSEDEAKQALNQLKEMAKQRTIYLVEAATVTKDADGKIHVVDTADFGSKKGAKAGAIIGGVMGLIFPPSIIASAIVGGGTGAIYGHFRDKGFSNKELESAGEELQPGQSGVIAVMVDRFVDQVSQGLEGYAKLDKYLMDADASAAVLAESSADSTSA